MPSSVIPQPVLDASATSSSRLFSEMCELLQAAIHVVSIRTTRMAIAGPAPDEQDQREFSLMSIEKGEAASESLLAMGSGWINLTMSLAKDTSDHLWATSAAAATLACSRSAAQWFERQADLLQLAAGFPGNPLKLADLATNLMQEILAPIHGRAMANAKRLGAA
ncbi:polyhydroxyalkanoate granule-associated phasin [Cupriavidus sp. BIC8F]|uniref:polyhydroxyalkanoate granule-associated phasin n=1 Tax=Cupriavidus sp. BIC8F TaxID=3079014 RepID=UPI0029161B06|nr:polyhydroxyalkanoate granule-associated phasin [Cupriavidus sp. BIC8F]